MPTQKFNIGPVPYEENCAQLGVTPNFEQVARFECGVYCAALIAVHGPPPEGARLRVVGAPHDFGTYYEAYVFFDPDIQAAVEYALTVERGLALWEEAGFPTPFTYGARSSHVERHFESLTHLIAKVMIDLQNSAEIMPAALSSLTAHYPEARYLADSLTPALPG